MPNFLTEDEIESIILRVKDRLLAKECILKGDMVDCSWDDVDINMREILREY